MKLNATLLDGPLLGVAGPPNLPACKAVTGDAPLPAGGSPSRSEQETAAQVPQPPRPRSKLKTALLQNSRADTLQRATANTQSMRPDLASVMGAALLLGSLACVAAPPELPCTPQPAIDVEQIAPQIIIVGEMHGTAQAPRFVSGLLCSLLRAQKGVILALERDGAEQPALMRYIQSAGTDADRDELWRQRAWRSAIQDGRNSVALMALIEDVRRLRNSGQRVGILAMQSASVELAPLRDDEKTHLAPRDVALYSRLNDRSMADSLLTAGLLYGNYKVVALAGGVHTATIRPNWAEPGYLPMGALVLAERPAYFIGLKSEGGTAWACGRGGSCGPREVGAGAFVAADTQIDVEVPLGRITASPPAAAPR